MDTASGTWCRRDEPKLIRTRPQVMLAILKVMREEYGSVEEYVKNQCKLSDDDIAQLRQNMTVKGSASQNGGDIASDGVAS